MIHLFAYKEEGASEAIIAKTFSSLTINKLSIVILDEIDMIASESAVKKAGMDEYTCGCGVLAA